MVKLNVEELHWVTARRKFELLSNCDDLTTKELSRKIKMNKSEILNGMDALIKRELATKKRYESPHRGGMVNLYNLTEKGKKYLKSINNVMDDSNV